ncbi:MAG TPA: LemA family protein [Rubrivivax sp.]|nr:LemA family protein [Rubrivivax sp.]
MSTQQLLLIAFAALLIFWMLGAYNRVVALRNAIATAWAQVEEPLQRRAQAIAPLADGLREALPDEQAAIEALLAAQLELQRAAAAMRTACAQAPRAAALAAAEAALAAALARLLALLDQHPAAADAQALQLAALQHASRRLAFARQLFNDAVQAYNDAVQQFPTRLLTRLFGFAAAGSL